MKCQAKTGANEQAIEREMFRSGAGRPPFRATPLTSTPNARAAALPCSGVPVGGDTSCSSSIASATVINTNLVLKRPTHVYYLTDEVLAVGSAYSYQNICDPISVTPFIRASWFGGHQPSHDATSVYERMSHTALLKSNKNYPIILICGPKQELKTWLHFSRCSQAVRPQGIALQSNLLVSSLTKETLERL